MRLHDKVAIVTGAARGIGEGIARCLAAEGASVAIIDIDGSVAQETASKLGDGCIGLEADCSEESQMAEVTTLAVERFGGLDIFVNNAGGGRDAESTGIGNPLTNITQEAWDGQLATNLRTTFVGSKVAMPYLKERGAGSIINIASIAGLSANPFLAAYSSAKAGVISLSRSLALELGPYNIRVNVICPGLLWTRVWEMLAMIIKAGTPQFKDMTPREIFLEQVKRSTPLGREQTPEDIGKLTAFLVSDDACNITGQVISVDGGITLKSDR